MLSIHNVNARYEAIFAADSPLVKGEGNFHARVALVGEAPGAREIEMLRPFVGAAGKNLDAFLEQTGLPREAVYITNAVKFRPTKQGKAGRLSNRTPTRAEVLRFSPWLHAEIQAIRPELIVSLGNTALFSIAGAGYTVGTHHGAPFQAALGVVFPLYHPAAIIYRRTLKETYAEDLLRLYAYLNP
ncbi:MAG: uracil-DNA glycosylase [Clostridia bacterium]|nr:uracil-DNA glycosylase [Clostridia bacterium]